MMNIRFYFYHGLYLLQAVVLILFCAGCRRNISVPHQIICDFPVTQTLTPMPIIQLDTLFGIYDVEMAGPYLVCTERKMKHFFSIFDQEFGQLFHFGLKGRGPDEYIAPVYCGQSEVCGSQVRFYVYDRALRNFDTIEIETDSLSMNLKSRFVLPQLAYVEPRVLFHCESQSYCGVSDFNDCRYFYSDMISRNPKIADPVLMFDNLISPHNIAQSCCTIRPDNLRIAMAYFNLPQIDIRTIQGTVIHTLFINNIIYPQEVDIYNPKDYFLKINANQDYIYALFDNAEAKESNILVFDWDGNPQANYRIAPSNSFTIDSQNKRIIAINRDQTQHICSSYLIP